MQDFWAQIDTQLAELRFAQTADEVIAILDGDSPLADGDAFFDGGGGDGTVMDSLIFAGWSIAWADADYYWCMIAPDGSAITYVEGDVYRGDRGRE
jgi:hypothetical protein